MTIVLAKLRYHLLGITLAKYKYNLPEIALEKFRYDRHGDCPPLLNHLQRDGTSILQVQSPWRSSIIKYMTISHRDCTLFFQGRSLEIVLQFLKYHLWEIVPSKMVTISGDRFGRSSPFSGCISCLDSVLMFNKTHSGGLAALKTFKIQSGGV